MAEAKMNLYQKLQAIQTELKAPKNLYNSFGKYAYRNAESICEALKPLEAKYRVVTTISDNIEVVGDRIYVTATVTVHDTESEATLSVSASARESKEKKGMDEAQITGATSSYARKYALNGMFLLDDTKDVDSEEYQGQDKTSAKTTTKKVAPTPKASAPVIKAEAPKQTTAVEHFPTRNAVVKICKKYNLDLKTVCDMFGLNRQSKDEDFKDCLAILMEENGVTSVDELN